MFKDKKSHNKIAKLSIEKFLVLPKTGKPNDKEWTVLSTIVIHDNKSNDFEVVALGTGSKCIGRNSMWKNGDILNDSHAEIICRRSFIKYFYNEIESFLKSNISTLFFKSKNSKLAIHKNFSFHFFTSHVPCGDAAIFPKNNDDNDYGNCLTKKIEHFDEDGKVPHKKLKEDPDIFRTGAKCLKHDDKQDKKLSGVEYHTIGAIRTKPGRGDATLSVSCSDKISKWTYLGIQGTLLDLLLEYPIYLSTITIAANAQFSEEAMLRAVCKRFTSNVEITLRFVHSIPVILQSDIDFDYFKNDLKQPCPSSIIWYKNCGKVEVSVEGKKQGVTKKNRNKKADVKKKNVEFMKVWELVKEHIFMVWTVKDKDLLRFDCNE